jgi:hypothetical protein
MAPAQTFNPRTEHDLPDRRRTSRFDSFTDEAEAEQWEREERSGDVDAGAGVRVGSLGRAALR